MSETVSNRQNSLLGVNCRTGAHPVMSVMASTNSDNDKKLKKLDKKSKKIAKKNKLKGSQNHINRKATENDPIKEKIKKKIKKKGKKKSSAMPDTMGTEDKTKQMSSEKAVDKLLELKQSNTDFSSNWKNLLKSLPKEEEVKEVSHHPAFIRKNKKGQLITNQKMSHPKAVLVGHKDKKKLPSKRMDKEKEEKEEVWFDDVDPMLLDTNRIKDPGEGLVKNNSFKGVTKILGMDCEMVGVGTDGVDSILARVSIVNHFGNLLYDKFVAPREKVISICCVSVMSHLMIFRSRITARLCRGCGLKTWWARRSSWRSRRRWRR